MAGTDRNGLVLDLVRFNGNTVHASQYGSLLTTLILSRDHSGEFMNYIDSITNQFFFLIFFFINSRLSGCKKLYFGETVFIQRWKVASF